jgi:hypothetical protein
MTDTTTTESESKVSLEARIGAWALIEVMGHRHHAGKITEELIAGRLFLRVEALVRIMGPGPAVFEWDTHFYSPGAIYCLTPTTEDKARANASRRYPDPDPIRELKGSYTIDEDDDIEDLDEVEPYS